MAITLLLTTEMNRAPAVCRNCHIRQWQLLADGTSARHNTTGTYNRASIY